MKQSDSSVFDADYITLEETRRADIIRRLKSTVARWDKIHADNPGKGSPLRKAGSGSGVDSP